MSSGTGWLMISLKKSRQGESCYPEAPARARLALVPPKLSWSNDPERNKLLGRAHFVDQPDIANEEPPHLIAEFGFERRRDPKSLLW